MTHIFTCMIMTSPYTCIYCDIYLNDMHTRLLIKICLISSDKKQKLMQILKFHWYSYQSLCSNVLKMKNCFLKIHKNVNFSNNFK